MKRSRLKFILPAVFLIAAVLTTLVLVQARPVAEREERTTPAPLVRVMRAAPADVAFQVTSQGTIAPRAQTTVAAQVPGKVEWVSPKLAPGYAFARGETMVRLDARDHRVAIAQAQAAIAQAKLRLSREQAEAGVAREEWSKLGRGEATPLVLREPQIAEANAALAAAEASLMQARLNLERSTIAAPFDGMLLQKHVDLGQYVAPGTPIGVLAASDYAEVELPVSSDDLAHVDLASAPVRIRAQGSANEWSGRIVRTGAQIDPRTRMLPLVARIERPFTRTGGREPLRIGEFVHATIGGTTARQLVEVPRAALRAGERVIVVDESNRLRFRDVTVARLTNDAAYLRGGVRPREQIVLSALDAPVEGMTVRTIVEEQR